MVRSFGLSRSCFFLFLFHLQVGFGQTICTPLRPRCEDCRVSNRCPSAFKETAVPTSKTKKSSPRKGSWSRLAPAQALRHALFSPPRFLWALFQSPGGGPEPAEFWRASLLASVAVWDIYKRLPSPILGEPAVSVAWYWIKSHNYTICGVPIEWSTMGNDEYNREMRHSS